MSTKLPCDEKALFLRIAEGDESAYRVVFDRYKAPFHSAAFRLTRKSVTAEDIVQEVFILLWTKRTLVTAADNPTHYLFTILYNSIYAHFKKIRLGRIRHGRLTLQCSDHRLHEVDHDLPRRDSDHSIGHR